MNLTFYKWLGFICLIVLFVCAAEVERRHLINQGYQMAVKEYEAKAAEQDKQFRKKEKELQDESDKKYAEYQAKIKELQDANVQLSASADSLRNAIARAKRSLSEASTSPERIIETGSTGLDLFAECTDRYQKLAVETGRLADKTNALIEQIGNK